MTNDELLIERFAPVMTAGLTGSKLHEVDAEVLHQLCLADGLAELLDWSRRGEAADPLACMWLGSLRWYSLLSGRFPDSAPEPPARNLDGELARATTGRAPELSHLPGSETVSLRGLEPGEMSYPSSPAQPDSADPSGLIRLIPLGLVPYIEQSMRLSWTEQALCLTQGDSNLHEAAKVLVLVVHQLASTPSSIREHADNELAQRARKVTDSPRYDGVWRDSEAGRVVLAAISGAELRSPQHQRIAALLRRQLLAALTGVAEPGPLESAPRTTAALDALISNWHQAIRPA